MHSNWDVHCATVRNQVTLALTRKSRERAIVHQKVFAIVHEEVKQGIITRSEQQTQYDGLKVNKALLDGSKCSNLLKFLGGLGKS